MNNHVTPQIASKDIIFEVTGQELIDLGYWIVSDEREDIFNLHINISKTRPMYKTKLIFKYTFEKKQ
jgi:hypothetical protein